FENRDMRGRSRNIVSVLIDQARPAVPPLPRRLAVHVCGRPRSCQARYVFPILEHGKILWKSEVHTARCAANEQRLNGDATRVEERPVKIPRVNCEVGADGGRTGEIAEADGWPKIPIPRWFASKPFADSIVPLAPIFVTEPKVREAKQDVGPGIQELPPKLQTVRHPFVVGIEKGYDVVTCFDQPTISGPARAAVWHCDDSHRRAELRERSARVVG